MFGEEHTITTSQQVVRQVELTKTRLIRFAVITLNGGGLFVVHAQAYSEQQDRTKVVHTYHSSRVTVG